MSPEQLNHCLLVIAMNVKGDDSSKDSLTKLVVKLPI